MPRPRRFPPSELPVLDRSATVPETLGRRDFLYRAGVLAGAVALAGCGLTGPGGTAPATVSLTLQVADYPELASVGGVTFVTESGGTGLAVVRTGAATFVALSRICPHQGGRIDRSGTAFQCSVHGARFDEQGTWIGGQSTGNMRSYPTNYDANTGELVIG